MTTANPLLEDLIDEAITAVTIALPTLGYFYPEDYTQVLADGTDPADVEIRPLGIMAELVARDPFLVASGQGIPRIIRHVCPSVLEPSLLCDNDMEAILIASRIASYGPKMKLAHVCQNPETRPRKEDEEGEPSQVRVCTERNEIEVDLTKHVQRYAPMEIDNDSDDHSGWLMNLPEINNQKVHLRPMVYGAAVAIARDSLALNRTISQLSDKPLEDALDDDDIISTYERAVEGSMHAQVHSLLGSILYVENSKGVRTYDPEHISEWLKTVPPTVTEKLREFVNEFTTQQAELTRIEYQCPNCGFVNHTTVELDPQKLFFYEAPASPPKKTPSSTSKKKGRPRRVQ